jgi:hypothetical protein
MMILGAAAALAVVVGVYVAVAPHGARLDSSKPALSEAEKAYLAQIVVVDAHMSAAESFAGNTVTYLDARVTNQGAKLVERVEIQLEFHDSLNRLVLRERARPVRPGSPPLKPGESRAFRISFDHMPMDWNQAPPGISTTSVHF